jgi:hypothetical protein
MAKSSCGVPISTTNYMPGNVSQATRANGGSGCVQTGDLYACSLLASTTYIYMHTQRERERDIYICTHPHIYSHIHVYNNIKYRVLCTRTCLPTLDSRSDVGTCTSGNGQ